MICHSPNIDIALGKFVELSESPASLWVLGLTEIIL